MQPTPAFAANAHEVGTRKWLLKPFASKWNGVQNKAVHSDMCLRHATLLQLQKTVCMSIHPLVPAVQPQLLWQPGDKRPAESESFGLYPKMGDECIAERSRSHRSSALGSIRAVSLAPPTAAPTPLITPQEAARLHLSRSLVYHLSSTF